MLATYFGAAGRQSRHRAGSARRRPACRSGARAGAARRPSEGLPKDRVLSLGVIDGRNIWRTGSEPHSRSARAGHRKASARIAFRSRRRARCCMSRSIWRWRPASIPKSRSWLAFAVQKLDGIDARWHDALPMAAGGSDRPERFPTRIAALARPRGASTTRKVAARVAGIDEAMAHPRDALFAERASRSARAVRSCRCSRPPPSARSRRPAKSGTRAAASRKGALDRARPTKQILAEANGAGRCAGRRDRHRRAGAWRVRAQRHGASISASSSKASPSPTHGWVQSYGSRCVKPPVIFGDVSRPKPMTCDWTAIRAVADTASR